MSVQQYTNVSYGLTQPLNVEAQLPIVSARVPTVNDKAQIGTIWVQTSTNESWILTSISNNLANWTPSGGGDGQFTSLEVAPGGVTAQGNIETSDGDVVVDTGNVNVTTGNVTVTAGNIVATAGNIVATGGSVVISNAAGLIQFGGAGVGPQIKFGAGDPNGAVSAPRGSLYLNSTGSGVNDRLWVNTTGAMVWTFVTTGA